MPKLPVVAPKDMLRYLLAYGCKLVRIKGSHHRISNPANNKLSTLPIHAGDDLSPGLFAKILKDLDINTEEFLLFMKKN